jgi:hypothetical protein
LLDQACAHCPIFPTAASRRSLGRVSVPVWPITLSGRLLIVALVSHYLTNKLISRGLLWERWLASRGQLSWRGRNPADVCGISPSFPRLSPAPRQITHVLLTRSPLSGGRSHLRARLACVKHAASVHSEPGSNSPVCILDHQGSAKGPRAAHFASESPALDPAERLSPSLGTKQASELVVDSSSIQFSKNRRPPHEAETSPNIAETRPGRPLPTALQHRAVDPEFKGATPDHTGRGMTCQSRLHLPACSPPQPGSFPGQGAAGAAVSQGACPTVSPGSRSAPSATRQRSLPEPRSLRVYNRPGGLSIPSCPCQGGAV